MIDKKELDWLELRAKETNDQTRLLKFIALDIVRNGKKKTWSDYSLEEYKVAYKGEQCRSRWKRFRFDCQPKGEWIPGVKIEDDFKELIETALFSEGIRTSITEDMLPDNLPEGFSINRIYSQQTKEGGVKWLHSLERDKAVDEAKQFTESAIQTFENIVLNHEPAKIYLLPQNKPTSWAMNVYISDAHIGAGINDSLFGITYNKEIYLSRIRSIVDQIEKQHQRYGTFDTINIVLLGDLQDGSKAETTRGGHKLVQNLNDAEQFDTFVKSFVDLFNTLVQEGFSSKLRFISATNDNHAGDFGYINSKAVEIYLNSRYPDIETIVSRDFIFHFKTGKRVHLACHGKDRSHMKHSIPWQLTKDHELWFENYVNYHGLNKHIPFNQEKQFITVIMGDLHKSKSEPLNRFHYKRVMALTPPNDYSDYNYARGNGYSGFEIDVYDIDTPDTFESRHYFLQ